MDYRGFRLAKIEELPDDVRIFTFAGEAPPYRPGSFFLIRLAGSDGKKIFRSFSAANHPSEAGLCFCVKRKGAFTSLLWNLRVGDSAEISGPYGLFALDEKDSERVFICGGTGVAPLRGMILQTLLEKKRAYLFHSAHTLSGMAFAGEMGGLERADPLFKFFPAVTREEMPQSWAGIKGRLDAGIIAQRLGTLEGKTFYMCGSKAMVSALVDELMAAGVPKEKIRKEDWG